MNVCRALYEVYNALRHTFAACTVWFVCRMSIFSSSGTCSSMLWWELRGYQRPGTASEGVADRRLCNVSVIVCMCVLVTMNKMRLVHYQLYIYILSINTSQVIRVTLAQVE